MQAIAAISPEDAGRLRDFMTQNRKKLASFCPFCSLRLRAGGSGKAWHDEAAAPAGSVEIIGSRLAAALQRRANPTGLQLSVEVPRDEPVPVS